VFVPFLNREKTMRLHIALILSQKLTTWKSLKEKIGEKEAFSPNAVIQLFNNL